MAKKQKRGVVTVRAHTRKSKRGVISVREHTKSNRIQLAKAAGNRARKIQAYRTEILSRRG